MKHKIADWKHVFKLDPARTLSEDALERICRSGTHALLVGGTQEVTFENTQDLLERIRTHGVDCPCVLEVSHVEAIVPGFDLYLVPTVLNAANADWIVGQHHRALRRYGEWMDWERIVSEGYIILNEQSAVGRLTGAQAPSSEADVIAYAELAERLFRLPIVYLEYSGMFGNMQWIGQAKAALQEARLFYGGGIDNLAKARQASAAAHTIVVGNALYEHLEQALETVKIIE